MVCVPFAMKTFLRRTILLCCLPASLLLAGGAFANDSMNCPGTLAATHAPLAAGDQNSAHRLQLSRKIEAGAEFVIDVCSADVAIAGSADNMLRLTVEIENPQQQHDAADYLQKLDVTTSNVQLQLHLFRPMHAKVMIELPKAMPVLTVNLGHGDLTLAADELSAKREAINVGYGHVNFQGDADAYEGLQVNIGLGSLHDNRKDGETHHFIVARSFAGKGTGSIEVNVGMGRVDLNPGRSKPI
jgi:hypothetical protein